MSEASVSIRLNPFKGAEGPEGDVVPWSPWGRILSQRPSFTLDPLFHAGCYYVQDSSAMFVGYVFRTLLDNFGPGIKVLDLCASPGGKTTDLASSLRERYGSSFSLVSNEVMKQRLGVLSDNVARWGDPNVYVCSADPAAFPLLGPYFDIIVADVPCSGEGMFRKDERARREWSPAVVQLCAARQKRILSDVWPSLREGGFLLYSTCTYESCENDDNLRWAGSELGGTILDPPAGFESSGVRTTACGSLLRDGDVPGEGQWVGALRKTAKTEGYPSADVSSRIRGRYFGREKGEMKGSVLVPSADYGLSIEYADEYPSVELDTDTALHFLHRDTIVLPSAPLGYLALKYHGHVLGFVKNLGNRCNNLLPAGRRILMKI